MHITPYWIKIIVIAPTVLCLGDGQVDWSFKRIVMVSWFQFPRVTVFWQQWPYAQLYHYICVCGDEILDDITDVLYCIKHVNF